ncbi:hypothetical protein [Propionivibrio sp.]|uniref:hypothetical protein n=1 Tax=Propionivibrio sp. TaxID=2212460 RepID=UPI0025D2802D|nr:hypothetical protein [Propionivibrio sp.]MBK7356355.1 hypothetical protein [Propionivibrio sp.]
MPSWHKSPTARWRLPRRVEFYRSNTGRRHKQYTSAWTPGKIPLYIVVTGASTVTSYTDYRLTAFRRAGRLAKTIADANTTLAANEERNEILEFTGTLTVLEEHRAAARRSNGRSSTTPQAALACTSSERPVRGIVGGHGQACHYLRTVRTWVRVTADIEEIDMPEKDPTTYNFITTPGSCSCPYGAAPSASLRKAALRRGEAVQHCRTGGELMTSGFSGLITFWL